METALAIWENASSNHGNLWGIYILVVSAVLGFSYSEHFSKIAAESRQLVWVTFLVLAVFMVSNVYSLIQNNCILDKAREALIELNTKDEEVVSAIQSTAMNVYLITALHLTLDFLVLYGLYQRIKKAN